MTIEELPISLPVSFHASGRIGDRERTVQPSPIANDDCCFASMQFDFRMMVLTGWLNRRVETWSYSADAWWRKNVSLDINQNKLMVDLVTDGHGEQVCEKVSRHPDYLKFLLKGGRGIINLPLCDLDKGAQITDWEIRDRTGKPLRLMLHGSSCVTVLNALNGALLYEQKQGVHHLSPISEREGLAYFLRELFDDLLPLTRPDGSSVLLHHADVYDAVYNDLKARLCKKVQDTNKWLADYARQAQGELVTYWQKSPLFRYFVTTYAIRRVAYARVDLCEDDITVVKYSLQVAMDVTGKGSGREWGVKAPNIFSGRLPLRIELDGLGVGEKVHVIVAAPDGTYFTPYYLKDDTGSSLEKRNDSEKFFVTRYLLEANDDISKIETEAEAYGAFTPGHTSFEANKTWYILDEQTAEDGSPLSSLYRRLPIGKSHVGQYFLHTTLSPRLGLRSVGYIVFLLFSTLAFLMCALDSSLYSGKDNGVFTLTTLFVFAPMVIAIVVNREEEPYIRRTLFRLPRILCALGIACDAVGFLLLMIVQASDVSQGEPEWVNTLVVGLTVFCGILALGCSVWVVANMRRKNCWSQETNAYDVFKVPIYLVE